MTPILQQFLSESREFLQSISQSVLSLEKMPGDAELMSDLFRSVHTLKGNSGLFDFPEMSRVLHAAEDLMSVVRDGSLSFSQELADQLLDAMDFVSVLLDEIQAGESSGAPHVPASVKLAESLRAMIVASHDIDSHDRDGHDSVPTGKPVSVVGSDPAAVTLPLTAVPTALRAAWYEGARKSAPLHWIIYIPESDCFFKGEDPFFQARQTPEVVWQRVNAVSAWPPLAELDPYRCALRFDLVTAAPRAVLDEHFRYVPEQVEIVTLTPLILEPGVASATTIGLASASFTDAILAAQLTALGLPDAVTWLPGRLRAIAASLSACYRSSGRASVLSSLEAALDISLSSATAAPLRDWLGAHGAVPAIAGVQVGAPAAGAAVEVASWTTRRRRITRSGGAQGGSGEDR
jgi:two-component system chemotaxis sensor kinase CheA